MIKYILFFLISNVYADNYVCTLNSELNDCLTPQQLKVLQQAYVYQQSLPKVPDEIISEPYKNVTTDLQTFKNKCTIPVNLLQQCPTTKQLEFEKLMNEYKNRRINNVSKIKTKSKSNHM